MIEKERRIKRGLIVSILIILIAFGGIVSFYQYQTVKENFNYEIKKVNINIDNLFKLYLENTKDKLIKRSNIMLANPEVLKAFYLQDREGLFQKVHKFYDRMKILNPHLKIMTFRLKDGSTFLRVHKPQMFGDKLNKKRKIIIDTNRFRQQQCGFEVGKLKMTYRVVTPIFYEGEHIGLVEVGIEPEQMTQDINHIFNIKDALLVKKNTLSVSLDKSRKQDIQDFSPARGDSLFKENFQQIDLDKNEATIKYKNENYIIYSHIDLYNHKHEITAKVLIAYNIEELSNRFYSILKENFIYIFLLISVLFIVLDLSFKYFLNQIEEGRKDLEQVNKNLEFRIEMEVKKSREKDKQMSDQHRLAQMGEMMSMIAHQWRQPLSAISATSISVLLKAEFNTLKSEKVIVDMKKISDFSQHLSSTINDFRNFFKSHKDKKLTNFAELTKDVLSIIEISLINRDIKLIQELKCTSKFEIYASETKQVILNLVKNAEDVLVEKNIKNPYIKILAYYDNLNYILEVSDNGGGIPEDIIDKIFDPYFSTKLAKEGTGLGLYMSKTIIEEHCNGQLTVSNNEDGAVFRITLKA